jgi:transcription antitermination factor NusG
MFISFVRPKEMNKNKIELLQRIIFVSALNSPDKMDPKKPGNVITTSQLRKQTDPKWYAIYTNPRAEKQVRDRLLEAGVEVFLPLQKTFRIWSDRKKLVERPLLSSYVFVKVIPLEYPRVYQTSGVVRFITFEGQPASIPENQIDNLRLLINSDTEIEISSEKFEQGDNVEVIRGSLVGLTGELVTIGSHSRVIIRIDRLDQNLVVNIPVTFLRRL